MTSIIKHLDYTNKIFLISLSKWLRISKVGGKSQTEHEKKILGLTYPCTNGQDVENAKQFVDPSSDASVCGVLNLMAKIAPFCIVAFVQDALCRCRFY